MDTEAVAAWLEGYSQAWGTYDPEQIGALFSADAVYYWIKAGHLPARRGPGNRLTIPWNTETEAACHARIASSTHLNRTSQPATAGEAV